jgi:outer membrane immunogenic protein
LVKLERGFKSKYDATLTGVGTVSNSQNIDGAIGGVQTGYNYQFGAWVWGLETDFQASGQKGGSTFTGVLPLTSITTDDKLDWFGTVRGRAALPMASSRIVRRSPWPACPLSRALVI